MNRFLSILVATAMCSACMSAEERNARIAEADEAACISYGAQLGTQEYFQCRMAKDQQRQANAAALAGVILSRPQPQPYVLPMPHQ
jgi:hypothetical protein